METVNKLEVTVAGWFKDLTHLPVNIRKWIATNAWWIAIIGMVISAIGLFFILLILGLVTIGLSIGGAAVAGFLGSAFGIAVGGFISVAVLVSIALFIAETILLGMSIRPLKALAKRGWSLLFVILLLNVIANVITNLFGLNLFALIIGLFWAGVGAYFLFEIREFFGVRHKVAPHTARSNPETAAAPTVTDTKV